MTTAIGLTDAPEGHQSREGETRGLQLQGALIANTYRLGRCIGAGGSSHVFEAEHLRLGRKFAIKVLRAELGGKRAAQRFRREAAAIARLHSEHIVSVIDCGELEDRTPFLVMELLEGEDLRRLLSHSAPLTLRRAVHLAIETCRGLTEVHRAGLVHRDLKPENLFIARRSSGHDWCKILDFGVAKMETSVGTAHDAIIGTVRYMAPEQLVDSSMIGPATDIHAVGALLFECLTGRSLVRGGSVQEAMFRIINASPRELMGEADLPMALQQVILSCLEKSPARRPTSTAELAESLARAIEAPASFTEATLAEDDERAVPRHGKRAASAPAWTLASGALLTTLVGAFLGWQVSPRTTASVDPPKMTPSPQDVALTTPLPPPALPATLPTTERTASEAALSSANAPPPTTPRPLAKRASPLKTRSVPATSASSTANPAYGADTRLERFDRTNPYGD